MGRGARDYDGKDYMAGVREWLQYLRERGRRETTLHGYEIKVGLCLLTLERAGLPTDPAQIGDREVHHLRGGLMISENGARDYLKVLGFYCEWRTGSNPVEGADVLWNNGQVNRHFIDQDILRAVLDVANACDRVAILLGSCMGLRRAEIVSARYSDIEDGYLHIHGKGHGPSGKHAKLRIPPIVMMAIDAWTGERSGMAKPDLAEDLIVANAWHRDGIKPYTPEGLNHRFKTLSKRAGVRVTPHSLRRLFATNLNDAHVDLFDIKTLMRHENVNTTLTCYLRADPQRLDAIMDGIKL